MQWSIWPCRYRPIPLAAARSNRAFLRRVVRYLAGETGITQFLDIGSGLPSQGNVHEIAREVNPAARVLYVDNDPVVLAHGQAALAPGSSSRAGAGDRATLELTDTRRSDGAAVASGLGTKARFAAAATRCPAQRTSRTSRRSVPLQGSMPAATGTARR